MVVTLFKGASDEPGALLAKGRLSQYIQYVKDYFWAREM